MPASDTVLELYRVGKRIAHGGFGFVHQGETPTGGQVAIKQERAHAKITRPYLQHEAHIYRLLSGCPCIPSVQAYGREGKWNIMVLDLLGASLESLFEKCGRRFTLKTTLMLGLQILTCIEHVHSRDIIHRDIKPDNFLFGLDARKYVLHVIDFGLARRFRHPVTHTHFSYSENYGFFGTTRFASLNAQLGRSQSRRDDLESALFMLVYFLRGKLPWQDLRGGTEKHREQRIREKKRTWTAARLCEGLPEELAILLDYSRNLGFEQQPDYDYARNLLRDLFDRKEYQFDDQFDWCLDVVTDEPAASPGHASHKPEPFGSTVAQVCLPTVGRGDYILVKLLARDTLEYRSSSSSQPTDNSLWQNPSLSRDEWQFVWRPALVLEVVPRADLTFITILPTMWRPDGLASIPLRRRANFTPLRSSEYDPDGQGVAPVPPWPLDHTYHYHTRDILQVAVRSGVAQSIVAHWHLNDEQVSRLTASRSMAIPSLIDYEIHPSDSESTRSVKQRYQKQRVRVGYPLMADIAPLTPETLFEGVEWRGSNGWLHEYNKIDARRGWENGYGSNSTDGSESDDDDASMYSGPFPSNRRASCTLAVPIDTDSA